MKFSVGFGVQQQEFEIPDKHFMDVLVANEVEVSLLGEAEVKRSMSNPIGTERLKDIVKPGEKIVIITSDITRPVPSYKIIPSILDELYESGAKKEDITVVLALGSHRPHTDEEKIKILGQRVYNEWELLNLEPQLISLGWWLRQIEGFV